MANDMFTTKSGKRVPVPVIVLPPDVVTTIMRMQEDYLAKGKRYGLAAIALDLILTGRKTYERRLSTAAKNKDNKNTGKTIKEYIRVQLILRKPIDPLVIAELSGVQVPSIEEDEVPAELEGEAISEASEADLTDDQLEQAISPTGLAS